MYVKLTSFSKIQHFYLPRFMRGSWKNWKSKPSPGEIYLEINSPMEEDFGVSGYVHTHSPSKVKQN